MQTKKGTDKLLLMCFKNILKILHSVMKLPMKFAIFLKSIYFLIVSIVLSVYKQNFADKQLQN